MGSYRLQFTDESEAQKCAPGFLNGKQVGVLGVKPRHSGSYPGGGRGRGLEVQEGEKY